MCASGPRLEAIVCEREKECVREKESGNESAPERVCVRESVGTRQQSAEAPV